MHFFNETASTYLQFFSMFMEVIGITLAYLEIRYKPVARKLEATIQVFEGTIKEFGYKLLENKMFSTLISVFVIVVFFFEIPYMAGFYDKILPTDYRGIQDVMLWMTSPVVFLFVLSVLIVFFAEFVAWLNRFSDGHAIGALGVVITFLGFLGETYQVLTIFYGV